MEEYTVGFLGNYDYHGKEVGYTDAVILHNMRRGRLLWITIPLCREADRRMAKRATELKKLLPGLRLTLVITESEEEGYRQKKTGLKAYERMILLDAADRYVVIPNLSHYLQQPAYQRRVIELCDLIVYSDHRATNEIRNRFLGQVSAFKRKEQPVVRYLRDELSVFSPVNASAMLDLYDSFNYIRRSRFHIWTDSLPQELLEKWLAKSEMPRGYWELGSLEDVAEVLRFDVLPSSPFLMFKVFACGYAIHRGFWMLPDDDAPPGCIDILFKRFRHLLELLAKARMQGIEPGRYDLLDFSAYEEITRTYDWLTQLNTKVTQLCDTEMETQLLPE